MNFDDFISGQDIGRTRIELAQLSGAWATLFPRAVDDDYAPPGLLVAILMRGYLTIVHTRPKGNIHVWQRLQWGIPLRRDATVTVSLRCSGKERRGDRRWLTFDGELTGTQGERHLAGVMRFLWAA